MLFLHTENMTKAQTTLTDVVSFLQHAALRQAGYPQVPLHPQSIQLILHYVLSLRQREKHLHVICHTHEQRCIKQTHIEINLFFPWPQKVFKGQIVKILLKSHIYFVQYVSAQFNKVLKVL